MTFDSHLGTELKNIPFPGERTAAEEVLRAYQTYAVRAAFAFPIELFE